jgi:hypothetical protein
MNLFFNFYLIRKKIKIKDHHSYLASLLNFSFSQESQHTPGNLESNGDHVSLDDLLLFTPWHQVKPYQ